MDAIPLHRRPTSLNAMLTSIVTMMEPYASDVGIKLKMRFDGDLPAAVSVDEDKIAWTIGTLIGNALRHVPRGSFFHPGGEIVVHAGRNGHRVRAVIEVTDDGPAFRGKSSRCSFNPPLPATYRVRADPRARDCRAHGGTMEAESTEDPLRHGTTIRMTLPA